MCTVPASEGGGGGSDDASDTPPRMPQAEQVVLPGVPPHRTWDFSRMGCVPYLSASLQEGFRRRGRRLCRRLRGLPRDVGDADSAGDARVASSAGLAEDVAPLPHAAA
ncbi:hypothetical protein HPB47_027844 [Ixodes persulcatus]|uniref:Uncharacterized protein n=1 Tax=Ixodes persulcatus TaxID=34615 RepID=A0AC60PUV9_IXOPE|nr:hypothetical protein HPB47_027844 [Ixodes persulcatus]